MRGSTGLPTNKNPEQIFDVCQLGRCCVAWRKSIIIRVQQWKKHECRREMERFGTAQMVIKLDGRITAFDFS